MAIRSRGVGHLIWKPAEPTPYFRVDILSCYVFLVCGIREGNIVVKENLDADLAIANGSNNAMAGSILGNTTPPHLMAAPGL